MSESIDPAETDQSALRQAALADVSLGGAWSWDVKADRLVADSRFANLYGIDPVDAARGVPTAIFFSIVHPDDRMRVRIAVAGVLGGAEVFAREYRLIAGDGAVRWVSARGRAHLGADDKPERFSGVLVDITAQKRLQEQLRIAQSAGGVGAFEHVSGFGTATVSEQFCRLLGLQPATDLPVRTINSVVQSGEPLVFLQIETPELGRSPDLEFRITRADDGAERWLVRRGEYLKDIETSGVRHVGVIYDITESKVSEAQLSELNETLEQRVEARTRERDQVWRLSRDLLTICDTDGIQRAVNPAWQTMLGYDPQDLVGARFDALAIAEDLPLVADGVAAALRDRSVRELDARFVASDGTHRWISWTLVPEGAGIYGTGRDITQRRQLEDQLRQSQKMEAVGQLTGGIAHDFNNLLTGIIGSLDMMQRRIQQGRSAEIDRYARVAVTAANRAAALTHRLLAFSRRQPLDPKPVNANRLVTGIEELLRRTLGEGIRLEIVTAGGLWLTLSDPNQLENAMLNLSINARDAMPNGGVLTVETCNARLDDSYAARERDVTPGQYVCISVTDTGAGMSPEVMAKAFDPFFTTKPIGQGTGLGLSMIYGFTRQSEGATKIYSEPGVGTTVKLYLPRFYGEGAEDEAIQARLTGADNARSGEVVLVVEDEASVRSLVVDVLEELGYQAIEAADGPSGLNILRSTARIDLLITDVGLPGLNGRLMAEQGRQVRPQLKTLFMTGYAENAAVAGGFLDPGMEMITKPFPIEMLASRIREMLAGSRQTSI